MSPSNFQRFVPHKTGLKSASKRHFLQKSMQSFAAASLLSTVAGKATTAHARAANSSPLFSTGTRFDSALLIEEARHLAKKPYQAATADLPDFFKNLTREQYAQIKPMPEQATWANEGRGFALQPLHRGFAFQAPVQIFVVENTLIRPLIFDAKNFDYGTLTVPQNMSDLGFSGLRILKQESGQPPRECLILQGANFWRAVAQGQSLGTVARALTLKPAETRGEEYPHIKSIWIEQPAAGSAQLNLHALFDSESVVGAVRLTLRASDITILDVETTLFPRVALDHVGLGGMAASFLFAPYNRRMGDDVRAQAGEVSGLQILSGRGEWVYRPLTNPAALQISVFSDENIKGFGLMQRDRDERLYLEDPQNWHTRPSLWIEPLGDWGAGAVQLLEIPSDNENNDNIITYWRPKKPYEAGSEISFAYRQYWCWSPPEKPALGVVSQMRTGRGIGAGRKRRFSVDFTGDALFESEQPRLKDQMIPVLSSSIGTLSNSRITAFVAKKTVRVTFDLDAGNEDLVELRLALEQNGKPLTETWLYRWTA
jgi:periplasmic glucans biosynthesis protein